MIDNFLKYAHSLAGVEVFENYSLTTSTTLGLTSEARVFIKAFDESGLGNVISKIRSESLSYLILGKGSNIILPDLISDVVVKLNFPLPVDELSSLKDEYNLPANTPINMMTGKAIKYGLSGWEVFTGIPATLGGAIWMNAGTSLGDIGTLVNSVKILRAHGKIEVYQISEGDFSYRRNNFLGNGDIIISANIKHSGTNKNIPDKIIRYLKKRSNTQPLTKKTCGCTFKNIAVFSDGKTSSCIAGKIIDIMNLKGFRYKDLEISRIHGNFIENRGQANQEDFITLVEMINSRIEKNYGHKLEIEAIVYRSSSLRTN